MSKMSRARRVKSMPGWSASLANSLKRLSMATSLTTGDVFIPSSMQTFSEIYCFDLRRSQSTLIKTLGLLTSHLEQAKRWNTLHNRALQWFDIVVWRHCQFWLGSNVSGEIVVVFPPRLADCFHCMSCCDFVVYVKRRKNVFTLSIVECGWSLTLKSPERYFASWRICLGD